MARDKIYGALILIFAILAMLYYTYWALIWPYMWYTTGGNVSASWLWQLLSWLFWWIPIIQEPYFAVAVPMWLAIILVLFIIGWIGYTMLTTPPPIPLEEIEEEEEKAEKPKAAKPKAKTEAGKK
jgi:hypothetical protein